MLGFTKTIEISFSKNEYNSIFNRYKFFITNDIIEIRMKKKASSILSAYSFISTFSLDELLNIGYKNGNPIPSFEENVLIDLCSEVRKIFEKEDNVLNLTGDIIIIGDIHGSLHDLLRILKYDDEKDLKVLFLGDYVDRGNFSLECITLLFALKVMYPDMVFLLRGNHEFDSVCSKYGFKNEIIQKCNFDQNYVSDNIQTEKKFTELQNNNNTNYFTYTESLYDAFMDAFSYLPIAAVVNQTTFCIHGGLSPHLKQIKDINSKIKRPIKSFDECSLLADLVWSDPSTCNEYKYEVNPRGYGYLFNHEAVNYFLKSNSMTRIVRAHQLAQKGIMKFFDDKCITVFSISSYKESLFNNSAILHLFKDDDRIKVKIFNPLNHLPKNEAVYAKFYPHNHIDSNNHVFFSLHHPILISTQTASRLQLNKNIKLRRNIPMISASTPKFITNQKNICMHKKESNLVHAEGCSE